MFLFVFRAVYPALHFAIILNLVKMYVRWLWQWHCEEVGMSKTGQHASTEEDAAILEIRRESLFNEPWNVS